MDKFYRYCRKCKYYEEQEAKRTRASGSVYVQCSACNWITYIFIVAPIQGVPTYDKIKTKDLRN